MKFDNSSPFPLLVVLFMVLGPHSGLLTAADARHPVHYLVFEMGEDSIPVPLFHRLVELGYLPESRSEEEIARARARIQAGEHSLTIEVWPAEGEPAFHNIVKLDRWIRGEYHGEREPDQGWQIENHRFRRDRVPFVVRVPQFNGAQLVLEGISRSVFDLDELAGRADSLPLASMAAVPSEVAIQEGSGNPGNRADLLIMGDGYTGTTDFNNDATAVAGDFFNVSPYREYQNYVNVLTLFTQSNETGSDHPPYDPSCRPGDSSCCADSTAQTDPLAGTYVDTAFDGRFCASNLHRLAVVNGGAALAAAAAVPDWDHILMLLNDSTYGGSGGFLSVTSMHALAVDIARHEYGHAFTKLADEYDSPFPGYPLCSDITSPACETNVTDETNSGLIKWASWIDAGTPIPTPEGGGFDNDVGLFEGARYRPVGMYRPRERCLMKSLGIAFGEVCAQSYVLKLYQGGWGVPAAGIEPIEPNSENPPSGTVNTAGAVTISVDLLAPSGGPPLGVSWWVDDVVQPGATGDTFEFRPPAAGTYEVEIRVEDATMLVHPDMAGTALESQRLWTVESSVPSDQIFSDNFETGDTSAWSSTVN